MGYGPETADEALRISLGRFTTPADLEALRDTLVDIVQNQSATTPGQDAS
jgi:cysteine sulfinate desulfinase/cysteine desulfurase-like protein